MKAMILAAGYGTRMGHLTRDVPKPLIKIGEYALIEHHLFALKKAGFFDVVINVSYHKEQIMRQLGDGSRYGLCIAYSIEPIPLGVVGGIQQARHLLGEADFLLLSADIFTQYDFSILQKTSRKTTHIVLVANPHYHTGDFGLINDHVLNEKTFTYANIARLSPDLFDCKSDASLRDVFLRCISNHALTGELFEGKWFNVGTQLELQRALES